ncbi:MAG: polysaccharide biosynthesis/export family protein, partial [Bacteroidales bacterium]|nr:polysaccharide biosynthesis/export family protein [Bacteroidales bacterium]
MKRIKLIVFIFLLAPVILSSCLTTKQTNLLQEPGGGIPSYPSVAEIGEYRINAGDELIVRITVPQDDANTGALFSLFTNTGGSGAEESRLRTLTVSQEGNIYFPYLGDIHVLGKTTLDIQTLLESRINKDLLTMDGCIVHVSLSNRYFSVVGESNAGRYFIPKEQLTIFQALSQSKDIKPYGDRSKVKIIRQTEEGTIIKTFDLRSSDIVNSEFYYIQPNDVIY